jgi:hypothetical protein
LSRKNKLFAIIATVAMLAGMLAFSAAPSFGGTTTVVIPLSIPNVQQSTFTPQFLGTILINGLGVTAGQSDTVTVTLPGHAIWNQSLYTTQSDIWNSANPIIVFPSANPNTNYTNAITAESLNALNQGAVVPPADYTTTQSVYGGVAPILQNVSLTSSMLTFTFTPMQTGTGSIVITTPISSIAGVSSGPLNAYVQDTAQIIPAGAVQIANVVTPGTTSTVQTTATMAPNGSDNTSILLSENTAGAMGNLQDGNNGTVYWDLPSTHFDWGANPTWSLGGGWSGWQMVPGVAQSGTKEIGWILTTSSSGNSRLELTSFGEPTTAAGTIQFTDTVTADYDAPTGNIIVSEGGTNPGLTATTLQIGDCGNYNITAPTTTTSVPTIFTGKTGQTVATFTFTEQVKGTLIAGRELSLTLPGGVRWTPGNLPIQTVTVGDASLTNPTLSSDRSTVSYTIANTSTTASTVQFSQGEVDVDAGLAPGPLKVTVSGSGVNASIVVGNIASPVTAAASDSTLPTVAAGQTNQTVSDFTLVEAAPGAIAATRTITPYATNNSSSNAPETFSGYLNILAPEGVTFASLPTIAVTSGNLDLQASGATLQGYNGTLNNEISIPVTSASTVASTITISDLKLNLSNTVPTGPVTLEIGGSAVVDPVDVNGTYVTGVAVANATSNLSTPTSAVGAATTTTAVFTIGATVYSVNGVQSVMDVAPYISDGRTFVPVRYLAYALGMTDNDVSWDASTQTVTLTKGSTTVTLNIGSTTETVNGTAQTMDVAPVIVNGRTMLPARWVAQAFGAQVGWNPATQEVVITY